MRKWLWGAEKRQTHKFAPTIVRMAMLWVCCMGGAVASWGQMDEDASRIYMHMARQDTSYAYIRQEMDNYLDTASNAAYKDRFLKRYARWNWFWSSRVDSFGGWQGAKNAQLNTFINGTVCNTGGNWNYVGPKDLGSSTLGVLFSLAVHPTNHNIIFVGSNTGGLWKTDNNGQTWRCLTDAQRLPLMGVSDIVVNPLNPDVIYIATGYTTNFQMYGGGILKTVNGGQTWFETGLSWSNQYGDNIFKMKMHPTDTSILYAVSKDQIYKTTNGFATANVVHSDAGNDIFSDIEFLPADANVVFVSSKLEGNTSGTKILISRNAGTNWANIRPSSMNNNTVISLATTAANPDAIYAVSNSNGNSSGYQIFKYDDVVNTANANWELKAANGQTRLVFFYQYEFEINQKDTNIMYAGENYAHKSINGGANFNIVTYYVPRYHPNSSHADVRGMKIFGSTVGGINDTVVIVHDGGVSKTTTGGDALNEWVNINGSNSGFEITQAYRVATCNTDTNLLVTGAQDNSSHIRLSSGAWINLLDTGSLNPNQHINIVGDGGECYIQHNAPNNIYVRQNASLIKLNSTGNAQLGNYSFNAFNIFINYRLIPIPQNTNNMFVLSGRWLYKATPANISTPSFSSTPLFNFATLNPIANEMMDLAVAANDSNVLYASFRYGTPTGQRKFFKSVNGGTSWTDITPSWYQWFHINTIAISHQNNNELWVGLSGFNANNRVMYSNNGGQTWTEFARGLPNYPVNHILYPDFSNPLDTNLYAATDIGIYHYNVQTHSWECMNNGLPSTVISHLDLNECDKNLYTATYGRGVHRSPVLDFIRPYELNRDTTVVAGVTWHTPNDILVKAGKTLRVLGTINMGKNTKIVIERGGKLEIDGGTITNLCGHTWQGIEVGGSLLFSQSPTGAQGYLNIKNNGTISYAKIAVKVGSGGIVQGTNGYFTNNWRSVEFTSYIRNTSPQPNNVSYFKDCRFTINNNYRDFNSLSVAFRDFVSMWEVVGVKFQNCFFEHQAANTAPLFQNSANMGKGIYSEGASYFVTDCTFRNMLTGIETGGSGNVVNGISIKGSRFEGMHTGIINNANLVMTIRYSGFGVGMYPLNDISATRFAQEGVVLNGTTNFTVQNNTFTVPSTRNQRYWQIGIRAVNTGRVDKTIYKNTFNGLVAACHAQGNNGINQSTRRSGLQYQCNNFNNSVAYDIVLDAGISSDLAPSQGSQIKAAGNKFVGSPLLAQLQYGAVGSPVTPVNYWAYQFNTIERPSFVVNTNVQLTAIANTCPDLRMSSLQNGRQNFRAAKQEYQEYKEQYRALIDGGTTNALANRVRRARANNANVVRNEVASVAPYLSAEVAQAFILNPVFSNNAVRNMLLNNPELMQMEDMRKFVIQQNRLNANQLATVIANSDTSSTNRGILEANMQNAHLYMQLAVNEMTEYYLNDSVEVDYDSVAIWLLRKETLVGAYQLVELDWQQRNYSTAFNKLASIPLDYQLDSVEQLIYNDYFALRNLIFSAQSQGRDIDNFNIGEQNQLKNIAERRAYYPNFQARSIENFFYDKNWFTVPNLPSGQNIQARTVQPTTTENIVAEGNFDDWAIYPNPAQSTVNVNLPALETEAKLSIVNLGGQVMHSQIIGANSNQLQLNVANLPAGLYVVTIQNETQRWAKNLVIQR